MTSRVLPLSFLSAVSCEVALLVYLSRLEVESPERLPLFLVRLSESSNRFSRKASPTIGPRSSRRVDPDGPTSPEHSGPPPDEISRIEGPAWALRLSSVSVCQT